MLRALKRPYTVRLDHLGDTGRLRTDALMAMAQDAAAAHAQQLGFGLEQLRRRDRTWLLRRFQLKWDRRPEWQEELAVETWPSGTRGVQALRDYRVTDSSGELVAGAASSWLLVDFARRRPVRFPAEFMGLVPAADESGLTEDLADVDADGTQPLERIEIRSSDCDGNRHLNHVTAVRLLLAAATGRGLDEQQLAGVDVEFLGEAHCGDSLELGASDVEPSSGVSSLWADRTEDGRRLIRMRLA